MMLISIEHTNHILMVWIFMDINQFFIYLLSLSLFKIFNVTDWCCDRFHNSIFFCVFWFFLLFSLILKFWLEFKIRILLTAIILSFNNGFNLISFWLSFLSQRSHKFNRILFIFSSLLFRQMESKKKKIKIQTKIVFAIHLH